MTNNNQIQENNNELRECIEIASALPERGSEGANMEAVKEFIFSLSNFEVSTREDFDEYSYSGNFTFNTKDTPTWLDFINSEYNKDKYFYFYEGYVALHYPGVARNAFIQKSTFGYNRSDWLNPYDEIIPHYFYRIGNYSLNDYHPTDITEITMEYGEVKEIEIVGTDVRFYNLNPDQIEVSYYSAGYSDHCLSITPLTSSTSDILVYYNSLDDGSEIRKIYRVKTNAISEKVTLNPDGQQIELNIPNNTNFTLVGIDNLTDAINSIDYDNNVLTINYTTTEPVEVTVKYIIE